jgi:type IV pilus assembly protein PilC
MASTTFKYSLRDSAGRVTTGRIEGDSREAVAARLRQSGIVLKLTEDRLASLGKISFGTSVKTKDITIFARQFATMINAGLSLTKCLSILAAQSDSKELREIIAQLGHDVEAGQSLSEAMSKHSKVFPPMFVNMVKAGETGGVLDEVLVRVADLFEQEASLRARIKSAMTYPIAMGALVMLILVAMLVFVVPTFEKMFSDMGGELPIATRILVGISNGATSWPGLIFVVVVVALIVAFKQWTSTESGRYIWDGIKLRIPIIKQVVRKGAIARFTRTFGTLVAAGVPILSALDIVADTSGNAVVARAIRKARSAVKEGEMIAKPLAESPVFPSMVVQMIAVGEETGALDQMLSKVADFYDEEVSNTVDSLTSIIEPVMMATLGGVVGLVVVALYMPMFQVITLIK